jgi:putative tryptophan/tyrosine transport system substrate-binding protein
VITRRDAFGGAASSVLLRPPAVRAQQDIGARRVGALTSNASDDPNGPANLNTFRQAMGALGWVDGRNLRIHEPRAGGDTGRLERITREVLAEAPEVVLTTNIAVTQALRAATKTIPIVFVSVSDPVANGLVSNLARPEANLTGVMLYEQSLAGKWLGLLKDMVPELGRVALLFNPDTTDPWSPYYVEAAQEAGNRLAVKITIATVRDAAAIERAIAALANADDSGLIVLPDLFNAANRATTIVHAGKRGVPAIYPTRFYALGGGLMSYGPDLAQQYRDAATYVDRILRGAKVADLPVQFPTRFELVINLKIAKAMGLAVPPPLLSRADEVIE